ncbi:hypothetical protein AGRA3207_003477 [Actinomadura graeca]|uniref:Integral membrane protein n=1 Tax=Actinomadura graeca TaxID=2750812 RepID=A0ABX8QWB3_9ACTN|nr:hypothetical protein [Actinomadura graeca]QXJ22474.1 hypothetical protein AGRA3207_003477 [Actinomadura graeca]
MSRLDEWMRERNSWVLCEEIRSSARELTCRLDAASARPGRSGDDVRLLEGARDELRRAENVIDFDKHRRGPTASHVTTAQLHLNSARSLWMKTLTPEELEPYLPSLFMLVKEHLAPADPRRIAAEAIGADLAAAVAEEGAPGLTAPQLMVLIKAVDAAREAALLEKLRAESFARIVRWMAASLFCLAVSIGTLAAIWKSAVPLCFTPAGGTSAGDGVGIVCPGRSAPAMPADEVGAEIADVARRGDYITIEIVGMTAASIAAASALRKVRGTSTPFGIPVALAVLKLPTGALTAVLGLLLMRGAFIPGLNALESPAQVIAWAVVLGYSQELFTKFVDRQGQAVLEGVRGPPEAADRRPPPEGTPDAGRRA